MTRLMNLVATAATVLAVGSTSSSALAADMPNKNMVATAEAAGEFTTLVAALKAAGLVATLEGKGPFTVFAPTDAAFAKLSPGHCRLTVEVGEQEEVDRHFDRPRRCR